ncbi:hypothetical protein Esti_006480 [Eimeria stiedai]
MPLFNCEAPVQQHQQQQQADLPPLREQHQQRLPQQQQQRQQQGSEEEQDEVFRTQQRLQQQQQPQAERRLEQQQQQQQRGRQPRGRRGQVTQLPAAAVLSFSRYRPQQQQQPARPYPQQQQQRAAAAAAAAAAVGSSQGFLLARCRILIAPPQQQQQHQQQQHPLPQLFQQRRLARDLDWSCVCGAVRLHTFNEELTCPICLEGSETSVAPLTAQCGHLMCAFCTCRLFGAASSVPCPMCNRRALVADLRPFTLHQFAPIREGSRVTFCLLCRPPGSSYAFLAASFLTAAAAAASAAAAAADTPAAAAEADTLAAAVSDAVAVAAQQLQQQHQQVLLPEACLHAFFNSIALVQDGQQMWREHIEALEAKLLTCLEGPSPDVETAQELQQALRFVEALARRAAGALTGSSSGSSIESSSSGSSSSNSARTLLAGVGDSFSSSNGGNSSSSSSRSETLRPLHERIQVFLKLLQLLQVQQLTQGTWKQQQQQDETAAAAISWLQSPGSFCFYQAADGQPVFLHPFCYQLLRHEAGGNPCRLPPVLLSAPVTSLHEVQQQQRQLRPPRLLSHLPANTCAQLAEVQLEEWLSSETLQHFQAELDRREQQRKQQQQRQQQEEAAAARAAAAAAAAASAAPITAVASSSPQQTPEDLSAFPCLPGACAPAAAAAAAGTAAAAAEATAAAAARGLSFAGVVAYPSDFRAATEEQRLLLHFPSLSAASPAAAASPNPWKRVGCSSSRQRDKQQQRRQRKQQQQQEQQVGQQRSG